METNTLTSSSVIWTALHKDILKTTSQNNSHSTATAWSPITSESWAVWTRISPCRYLHTLCIHIDEVHKPVNSIALTLSSVCYRAYANSFYKLPRTNLTLFQLRGGSPLTPGISQSLPLFRSTGSCRNMVRMAISTSCLLKCLPLDLLSPFLLLERPCLLTGSGEPGHLVFEPNMWWSSQRQWVTQNNPRS